MSSEMLAPFAGSLFIVLREGFEAMLIVMLIFTYLKRFHAQEKEKFVWYGIATGIILSIGVAMGFKFIAGLTHEHEEWFEGVTMLAAAGVLGYLAFWCHGAKNHFQEGIISKLKPLDETLTIWSSLALTFAVTIAIAREGFEIVLFYAALFSSTATDQMAIWVGGAVGTVALLGVYAIMRKGTNLIPTDKIFLYSKYFFIILALYFGYQGIEEIFELLEH